jgi:hypothetical protein
MTLHIFNESAQWGAIVCLAWLARRGPKVTIHVPPADDFANSVSKNERRGS